MNARQRIVKLANRSDLIFVLCAFFDVKSLPRIRGKVRVVQKETTRRGENESEDRANYKYKRVL